MSYPVTTWGDNGERHSVRASLHTKTSGALERAAELRAEFNDAGVLLRELFTRYEKSMTDCEAQGIATTFQFDEPLAAAYGAWRAHRDTPKRIELAQVSEAPIPPEGE